MTRTLKAALLATAVLLPAGGAFAQTLNIGLQDDPDLLDPHRARTFVGRIVFTALCDKLVDITPDLQIVPQLATRWETSADGLRVTMDLRTDATFHDGTKIDAAAVKANLDRARELPDSLRKSEIASIKSVDVVDADTVQLNLSRPDAALLSQLSDRAGMIMSPAAFDTMGTQPVCSGPYRFKDRVQNDRITLEKYDGYWDAAAYPTKTVVYRPIPDTTVRFANLQSGDLDIIERIAPTDMAAAEGNPNLTVVPVTGLGYQAIAFNLANGAGAANPLATDARLRRAFDKMIDRSVINDVVGLGSFTPATQPFPPASFAAPKDAAATADVEGAKALLKEAGVTRVPLTITYGNNTTSQQVYELIQAMGAEVGFDIQLQPTEFAALQSTLKSGDFQAGQSGWSGRVDPDGNIHQHVTCGAGLNDGHYCNEAVDKLLNEARSTNDQAKRVELYTQANALLEADKPVSYLYFLPYPFAHKKALQGFVGYPDGMIRLRGVSLAN
ncbi:ABC transporter substrate-binding protein [Aureimonas sp. AU4]|uniref:ABC transporter substrate-binding protein n=1 Tax=Aureimonas sp. AU4 TaxID=1638163 RepID=UPI0007059F1C|nr:ABC transporter substrate-binding protein [Aureimonas sp. AU4]BAT30388.1 extracellular solute-binding protein, family 5 middle family protein 10 [Aureimonas sp. AU4]